MAYFKMFTALKELGYLWYSKKYTVPSSGRFRSNQLSHVLKSLSLLKFSLSYNKMHLVNCSKDIFPDKAMS